MTANAQEKKFTIIPSHTQMMDKGSANKKKEETFQMRTEKEVGV